MGAPIALFNTIDTTPPRTDLVLPRNVQRTYTVSFSLSVTGQTVQVLVKRRRRDADDAAVLTKSTEDGSITLNTSGTLANFTILATDCSDRTVFPGGQPLWYGVHTADPPDMPCYGTFVVLDEP